MKLRNIAIIAHVDHGKTTLVDEILYQTRLAEKSDSQSSLILDNNDLERERGITILSKNVSVQYKDYKINIIDTPGHADFGGEVERVLNMADGVLLLVDAFEGPMPQTRFVLTKALAMNLKPLVVINKVDKPNCRPDEVHEAVFELFFNLNATEEQLDFPVIYGSSKEGWMSLDWKTPGGDMLPILDAVIEHIPPPKVEAGDLQMQITSIDYSSFTGRIAIGRLNRGQIKSGQKVRLISRDGSGKNCTVKELYVFEGLGRKQVDTVDAGDICAFTGIDSFDIGDTVTSIENPEALPPITIDEPTISMLFTVNNSPFYGREGKYLTSRHILDRLTKETEKNLAMRVEKTDSPDAFEVFGRGIMHLSILIETMRREGYEFQLGQPRVIIKVENGKKLEPVEELIVDVPESYSGKVIEIVTKRKGSMTAMVPKGDVLNLAFDIPSRGLIGLRTSILTISAGEAVMSHRFKSFEPWKDNIPGRTNGALISMENGTATGYSIDKLQDRGRFFVKPGDEVYEGQVVGENIRADDLVVNVTKGKQLTNMRASGSDDQHKIAPPLIFSLEEAMEYIQHDEYLEVTPESLRMRKIKLKEHERKRSKK